MQKLAGTLALLTLPLVTTLQAATQESGRLAHQAKNTSADVAVMMNKKVAPQRIVSAGNGVTELIYALGAGNQVIAVDSTSDSISYPNWATISRPPNKGRGEADNF